MSVKILCRIPSKRRDAIFSEIQDLVREVEAIDRSLEPLGEGMAIDEALEEIVGLLSAELKRAKKAKVAA